MTETFCPSKQSFRDIRGEKSKRGQNKDIQSNEQCRVDQELLLTIFSDFKKRTFNDIER